MKRLNNFNDDYFEKIDTEDKAYFLGLLFADGNIYTKRHRVQITLVNEDAYILKKFADCIGYTGKMYIDREKYSKLILPSKKMCDDLTKLGCTATKSLSLKFPSGVPKHLLHHFIRGCFDGDGHVSKRGKTFNVNFTSSEYFINDFIKILESLDIEHTGSRKRYTDAIESAHQIYIRATSARKFFDYIYKDSIMFLTRKKEVVDMEEVIKEVKVCKICSLDHHAKGFCKKHYITHYYKLKKHE